MNYWSFMRKMKKLWVFGIISVVYYHWKLQFWGFVSIIRIMISACLVQHMRVVLIKNSLLLFEFLRTSGEMLKWNGIGFFFQPRRSRYIDLHKSNNKKLTEWSCWLLKSHNFCSSRNTCRLCLQILLAASLQGGNYTSRWLRKEMSVTLNDWKM